LAFNQSLQLPFAAASASSNATELNPSGATEHFHCDKHWITKTKPNKRKDQTMKTRSTSPLLVGLVATLLTLAATSAQAFVVVGGRPVGITFGQTARINILNTSHRAFVVIGGKFLDSDGNALGEFGRQIIEPGKMISFDLDADAIARTSNRIQIRVVISIDNSDRKSLLFSTEVFENSTGKTTIFLADPEMY
jgi:hypothetical protein